MFCHAAKLQTKSETFHVCTETSQEPDFAKNPDSSSSFAHIFTWINIALPFLFSTHIIFEKYESTVLCVVSVSEKLWYFVHAWQFEGFSQNFSKSQGTKIKSYEMKMAVLPYCDTDGEVKWRAYFSWSWL